MRKFIFCLLSTQTFFFSLVFGSVYRANPYNHIKDALDSPIEIIMLSEEDWKIYRDLRLESVKEFPQAFGSTYEEELDTTEFDWKRRLKLNMHFAKYNGKIVGMIGAVIDQRVKLRHSALLISFYVLPEERGKGIGSMLLSHMINQLSLNAITKIHVKVTTTQAESIRLYKKFRFHIQAILINEYYVDGVYFDQYLMSKFWINS